MYTRIISITIIIAFILSSALPSYAMRAEAVGESPNVEVEIAGTIGAGAANAAAVASEAKRAEKAKQRIAILICRPGASYRDSIIDLLTRRGFEEVKQAENLLQAVEFKALLESDGFDPGLIVIVDTIGDDTAALERNFNQGNIVSFVGLDEQQARARINKYLDKSV